MKVRWVTNIPTPYRNHRHRLMTEAMRLRGLDYAVYYMAWTEPDRHWTFAPGAIDHPHRIFGGLHAPLGGIHFHFNPSLISTLRQDAPDLVVIGGWSMPTLLCAPLATRRSLHVLGVESNLDSVRLSGGVPSIVRTAMVRNADAFVIPGARSRQLIETIDPASAAKPMLLLPNLVDESVWRDGVAALRDGADHERAALGVSPEDQLWVCPARLETFKGVQPLLELLAGERGFVLAIAGEGSLRRTLEKCIERDRLPVRLLGQCDQGRMQRLYAAADLFVLPSLSDPNPLSAIESAAAGLPQWLSVHCGNYDDLVDHGDNGFRYIPGDVVANRAVLREILSLSRVELAARGRRSAERFARKWDSKVCIERLVGDMHDLAAGRRHG